MMKILGSTGAARGTASSFRWPSFHVFAELLRFALSERPLWLHALAKDDQPARVRQLEAALPPASKQQPFGSTATSGVQLRFKWGTSVSANKQQRSD